MAHRKTTGFTLIEMIGVMAIIAILASTIAPSIIKDVDRAVSESEQDNLKTLAHDLNVYIRENKIIPSASDWVAAVASVSNHPSDKITQNKRFHNRGYYVDPRFFTTSDSNFSTHTQNIGNKKPNSPRIMLVSSLKANAPSAPTSTAAFNAIWNQTSGASLIESEDIKIERINLKSNFHRVILNKTSGNPGYKLEKGSEQPVDNTEIYVLSDTKISLLDSPYTNGGISKVFITNRNNSSYTFDGAWKEQ